MYYKETRKNCPICGDTKERLYIKETPKGWLRFCHNENCYKGKDAFLPKGDLAPKEIVESMQNIIKKEFSKDFKDLNMTASKPIKLPSDFKPLNPNIVHTQSYLRAGYTWLQKYGIMDKEIEKYNIGYSHMMSRLILPVFDSKGDLIYYQGRNLGTITNTNPKYLNLRNQGAKDVFFRVNNLQASQDCVIIVEDILSAIKIGRTANTLALLGSYFPPELFTTLKQYKKICVWLDADKYTTALHAGFKIKAQTGSVVKVIYTSKDPKEYDNESVQNILSKYGV